MGKLTPVARALPAALRSRSADFSIALLVLIVIYLPLKKALGKAAHSSKLALAWRWCLALSLLMTCLWVCLSLAAGGARVAQQARREGPQGPCLVCLVVAPGLEAPLAGFSCRVLIRARHR